MSLSNQESGLSIEFGGEQLMLLPDKAIWLKRQRSLLLADLHLGKVSHFRKHGMAIPPSAEQPDLLRLRNLCNIYKPAEIIFLGDLFHSDLNGAWEPFAEWIASQNCICTLVQGNHDILPDAYYQDCGILLCRSLLMNNLYLSHDPVQPPEGSYNIAGHVHPGVRLQGNGRQSLRLPCFFVRKDSLLMPAFGSFTGLHIPTPEAGDQIFAIAEDRVLQVL